jgi:voltage-gated potassium channel
MGVAEHPTRQCGSNPLREMNARGERMEQRFRVPIIIATLLVIPVLVLQSVTIHGGNLPAPWYTLAAVGNWAIWLTFLAEVIAMLAVVSDRRAWLRGHILDVAIVVLTPPLAPAAIQSMRLLRLLRLVRLARFVPLVRSVFTIDGVRYAALLAFVVFLSGAQAFASVENKSLGVGMYWAISTMTTVGYGDVTPKTSAGRIIAAAVMLVGIGFIAIVTGAIAQRFITTEPTVTKGDESISQAQAITHAKLDELASRMDRLEQLLGSDPALEPASTPGVPRDATVNLAPAPAVYVNLG